MATNNPPIDLPTYVSPLPANENFYFVSAYTVFPYTRTLATAWVDNYYSIKVINPRGETIFENVYERNWNPPTGITEKGQNIGIEVLLQVGVYTVEYKYGIGQSDSGKTITATYTFVVVENKYPLKKWTVTEVINRLLDLCEPIRRENCYN